MLLKVDVTFYQTTEFTGEVPSIHLTKDIFYGGFALSSATTIQPFIDESIYYIDPDALYKGSFILYQSPRKKNIKDIEELYFSKED